MSYIYKQQHVSTTKYSIKCPFTMSAEYLTVHNTYNDAPAKNEASYHNSNNNQVSFHIAIDDVEAIEVVPLNRNAWHCGDGSGKGNRASIGIEICYSKSGGDKYNKAEANAVILIAKMLKERGWGIDRVKKHQDWSGKYCPHRILDNKSWGTFLNRVQNELDILNGKNKGELTMTQYNELDAKITALQKELDKKQDKYVERQVSDSHKVAWEFLKSEGITDGSNPQNFITREQFATMLKRYHDKFVK
ncbi:peptidoglycan recognition protein family protein [Lysinibacillus sp. NPDC093712]|uniref:peptidoglycan recognition protein family protein n=1 Tax=Lysinibacillus sp. NPDC093712 TaxID=3390579 RepID=UPI003D08BA55